MSKESHSFSVSVACQVGVNSAIMLQHFIFLQRFSPDGWVKKSAKAIQETYPYLTEKEIRGSIERLCKKGYVFDKIENPVKADRTKSFFVSELGHKLYETEPFDKRANGVPERANGFDKRENDNLPKGQMLIKEGSNVNSSVVVETAPQAAFPSTPPPETEIQTAVTVRGEIGTLEADFEKMPPPVPPPPPAGQKTRRAAKAETTTAEILSHLKGEVVDYFHAIHAAWQEWSRYKADEKRSRYKPQGAARTITALFNETGGDAELGREAIRFSMEKNWAGIFMPKQSDKHAAPAQRYSLADRPQCEHTPDGLLAELRAFYTASPGLLCAAQEYAGTKYGANDLKAIIQKFCANQVGKGRIGKTFEQHHADLSAWLLNQKNFEQQGPKDNNPYSNRPDGPKMRSDVNPYARHKIIS